MVVIIEKRNLFFNIIVYLTMLLICCGISYTVFVTIPQIAKEHKKRGQQSYISGSKAYKYGVPAEANPYNGPHSSNERIQWLNGWMDEKSKLHK